MTGMNGLTESIKPPTRIALLVNLAIVGARNAYL